MAAATPAHQRLPGPRDPSGPYRILLVCMGNICRSPMAEVVLRHELARAGLAGQVHVESAGIGDWNLGNPMDRHASAELAARGYDVSAHRARQLDTSWLRRFDLIAAMDRHNLEYLLAGAPDTDTAGRVRMFRSFDPRHDGNAGDLDVPDPYQGPRSGYTRVFELVQPAARGLAGELAALLTPPA